MEAQGHILYWHLLSQSFNHASLQLDFLLCHDDHEQITDTDFHNVNGFCAFRGPSFAWHLKKKH